MSARVVLAVAVALAAGSAWADEKVQPASKVSSGETSSKVSSSPSSSSYSSPSSRSSSARSSSERSSSARSSSARSHDSGRTARGPQTDAQRRHPRPGTGTGRFDRDGRRGGSRYGWGSPYYGYGYGYGYGGGYYPVIDPYYGGGKSCWQVKHKLKMMNFKQVQPFDCSAPTYRFTAKKNGNHVKVKTNVWGNILAIW